MRTAEFKQQTVVVTGASQGIGASIASAFASAGGNVVVHYRSNDAGATEVVKQIQQSGGHAISHRANLECADDVEALFAAAASAFEPVSVLINNAATFPNSPLLEISPQQWRSMFADNVESTFHCTQAAGASMRHSGGGSIVNIASIAAINPGAEHAHYNSAKAAVVMFTKSAALELGAYGIRVNAIAPGLVDRPDLETQWPEGVRRFQDAAPLSCVVQAEDIANACIFLASDRAARISGVLLPVDSGVSSAAIY